MLEMARLLCPTRGKNTGMELHFEALENHEESEGETDSHCTETNEWRRNRPSTKRHFEDQGVFVGGHGGESRIAFYARPDHEIADGFGVEDGG